MKRLIIWIFVLVSLAARGAAPTLEELTVKADRFIRYHEYSSALAMLQLISDRKPDDSAVTGKAIAVAGLLGESGEQLRLFRAAVDHRQRFDSVFSAVESQSFALQCGHVYEHFLKMIAREEPWTARSIDSYLMRYYIFRRDGSGMVEYAGKMLAGMPDSQEFLHTQADGYMLEGQFDKAAETLREILKLNPDNLRALLQLGFYLESTGDIPAARELLSRACALQPTPYLRQWLEEHGK